MTTAANIIPTAGTDGTLYASAVPLTFNEAALGGGSGAQVIDPVPVSFGAAILAVVQLAVSGYITGNNTYVVMQMDLGDGVWVDINWAVTTINQGTATFVFCNGVAGANTFQQSRNSGQPPNPQTSGSNQVMLSGRIRFVGKTTTVGGSSNLSGTPTQVTATIRYKLLPLN